MNTPRLSVIVPCYDEEKNMPVLLERFGAVFAESQDIELILVDNGSHDRTAEVIKEMIAARGLSFARLVRVDVNRGYGYGILSGLADARGEVLAWTHADLQADPGDVLRADRLYRQMRETTPRLLVKGYRKNRKIVEKILSLGMQLLSSRVLGCWLSEVNAQPKLFGRDFYKLMREGAPHDFSLDLYVLYLAKRKGYVIESIPVDFKDRLYGEAKGGGGSDWPTRLKLIRRTYRYIFELKNKLRNR